MERDCESELSKLNIEQNACIYHFGASVIHGQRSNILRLRAKHYDTAETLLAVITALSAKFVVGNAISFIQKQRPLLFRKRKIIRRIVLP